ncbi:HD domain-containing protein [Vogesella fluminis]|nr:HD domain-containing protein [Vogesella fluminis]
MRVDNHPEIDCGDHVMRVLDYTAACGQPLSVRFAALMHDLGKARTPADILPRHLGHEVRGEAPLLALCEQRRVPADCRDLARLATLYHTKIHRAAELRADTVLRLLRDCDALRRPERFLQLLEVCVADARGRLHFETCDYPQAGWLRQLLAAAQSVDAGAVARNCADKRDIPQAVDRARVAAIAACCRLLLPTGNRQ